MFLRIECLPGSFPAPAPVWLHYAGAALCVPTHVRSLYCQIKMTLAARMLYRRESWVFNPYETILELGRSMLAPYFTKNFFNPP